MANESKSCERCIYSRPIISENGIHSICTFSSKKATKCMVENRIFFKENISLNHDKKWFGEGVDMDKFVKAEDVKDLLNGLDSLPWEDEVEDMVDSIIVEDVAEIVRCKDCFHKVDYKGRVMCSAGGHRLGDEWFNLTATFNEHYCSFGRKNTN